jgi:hypothetical protein
MSYKQSEFDFKSLMYLKYSFYLYKKELSLFKYSFILKLFNFIIQFFNK